MSILHRGDKQSMTSADNTIDLEVCTFASKKEKKRAAAGGIAKNIEIIFVTGWNETYIKYYELFKDFNEKGFTVHTYDHRSQGLSGRSEAASHKQMSYVEDFDDYINDFFKFVELKKDNRTDVKFCLIGHSMGGLVSLHSAGMKPELFECVIVNAPMIQFKTDGWPWHVAGALGKFFVALGLGPKFAIGSPQPHWEHNDLLFGQECTHDQKRLTVYHNQRFNNPQVCLAGPSFRWVLEAYKFCDRFMNIYLRGDSAFPLRTLMFKETSDRFVKEEAVDAFCQKQKAVVKKVVYHGAYHELFSEYEAKKARKRAKKTASCHFFG